MPFTPTPYTPPDFTLPHLVAAPDVTLVPAPKDFVAPEGYHAMSIYPEYLNYNVDEEVKEFFDLFYHVQLTDEKLENIYSGTV